MSNYRVQNIGLGDLIFFSTFVLNNHEKNTTIGVNLSKKVLEKLRNNSNNYKNFCFDLLKIILKDFVVKEIEDDPEYSIWNSSTISSTYFHNEKVLSEIKNNLLTTEPKKYDTNSYIVLFTKVRDLHKREYQKIYKDLYEYLNNCDKKIILLGEQKVIYNEEYKVHGEKMIYSLYDDYIKNINPSKIIDLTKETFDFEEFSITNFLSDFKLIDNSFFTIVFGGGGFFCSSLFTGKLLSLTNVEYESIYKSKSFPNIFSDKNNFLGFLNEKIEKVTMNNYYGQWLLDKFIHDRYFQGKTHGISIECGAFDGLTESTTKFFEESMSWSTINVEAYPEIFESLKKNRPLSINVGIGLSDKTEKKIFNHAIHPVYGKNFGNGSLNHVHEHIIDLKTQNCTFESFEIDCDTYKNIIDNLMQNKFNGRDVDLFVLDVEGYELNVIRGMENSKYLPKIICVEYPFVGLNEVTLLLSKLGYKFDTTHYNNAFYLKK